jgi:hypothetical protein
MAINQNRNVPVTLLDVMLSYAYLASPYVGKPEPGKTPKAVFTTHGLYAPGSPNHVLMSNALRQCASLGWGAQGDATLVQLKGQDRLCQHDGNITKGGVEPYKDMLFVSASNDHRPRIVVTRNGVNVEIGVDDPMFPYSGCRANLILDLWPQSPDGKPSQWGKRINATLTGVQFVSHGQALSGGGRIATPDEFPTVETAGADAAPPGAAAGAGPSLI